MSIEKINQSAATYSNNASIQVKPNVEPERVSVEKADTSDKYSSRSVEITDKSREQSQDDSIMDAKAADAIKKAVEEINKQNMNKTVQFGIHEKTGRMTIKILNKDTKEVIKEFPAEKTLDLIAKAWEMAGMMVDEKR